ncbi:alpha/beta hydrolase [Curtobacterium ammoniigenes]|uniref:alpha/beta hydrolase n=1 Tax=Curtobacterium ammoniigenes TaxID=395387 RepID=UPI00083515C0|nr:alpha/beta hydrolase [Curtobacterium ammoniigenes]
MSPLQIAGEPQTIDEIARSLARDANAVSDAADRLERTGLVPDVGWTGSARDQFDLLAPPLQRAAVRVGARIAGAADVLHSYAADLDRLQQDERMLADRSRALAQTHLRTEAAVRAITDRALGAQSVEADRVLLRSLTDDLDATRINADRLDQLMTDLEAQRASAIRRAVAGLESLAVLDTASASQHDFPALSDAMVLARLSEADPETRAALIHDEALADRLRSMPAPLVAEWWDALGGGGGGGGPALASAAQLGLVVAAPALFGNMDGVAYWARDLANRTVLDEELRNATETVDVLRAGMAAAAAAERPALLRELDAALQRWTALTAFARAASGDSEGPVGPRRNIVSFDAGAPPLGSIAIGDLDAARSVSYLVPGMGTTLASSGGLVTAAGNVLWQLQQDGRHNDAVVAWLGYQAPPMVTESLGVLTDAHAVRGAPLLASDIAGLRARRGDASINVVGHSYGSTTAALALAEHPELGITSFVTLGSAGIPARVQHADALGVQHVFAVQGAEIVAAAGRFGSVPHRADPAGAFGGSVIWSGPAGGDGGVTSHDLLVDDHDATELPGHDRHGYLDRGTGSLAGVAAAIAR